jgi:hypothetical protein
MPAGIVARLPQIRREGNQAQKTGIEKPRPGSKRKKRQQDRKRKPRSSITDRKALDRYTCEKT